MSGSSSPTESKKYKATPAVETGNSATVGDGAGTAAELLVLAMADTAKQDLLKIDAELEEVTAEATKEFIEVEKKYNMKKNPFYEKRAEVAASIPTFWMTAMVNHPQLKMLIDEDEKACLSFMTKLVVEDKEPFWKITFIFKENPYFKNEELVKAVQLRTNGEPEGISTEIDWKEGKKISNKSRHAFFNWFAETRSAASDFIAESIKNDLWPNATSYYYNKYMEDDEDDDEDIDDWGDKLE